MQQSDKLQTVDADLLIKPDLSAFNKSDMSQVDELMKKGYEDSKKALKKIAYRDTDLLMSSAAGLQI